VPLGLLALVVIAFLSSPFHHPALVRAAQRGDAEAVARAIARGANLNRRTNVFGADNFTGWTALMWAAYWRNAEVVRLLTDAKADLNPEDRFGRTALHLVFDGSHRGAIEPTVRVLLEAGANPTSRMHGGETPLHLAVNRGDMASILLLIEAGADVNAVTKDGVTALANALSRRDDADIEDVPHRTKVVDLLRAHGANLVHVRPDGKRLYETPPASTEAPPAPTDQVNAPADPNANAPK
jgi:ankyrin repeat protein